MKNKTVPDSNCQGRFMFVRATLPGLSNNLTQIRLKDLAVFTAW